MIWIIKHNPNKDPKFHQIEISIGVGNLINELSIIFINKCDFIIGLFILIDFSNIFFFIKQIFTIKVKQKNK